MTPTFSAILLLIINLGLLWLMMAAPIGRRTILIRRPLASDPQRLWDAVRPGGPLSGWNPSIVSSQPDADNPGRIAIAYRQPDRRGKPVLRVFEIDDHVDSEHGLYEYRARVVDDSTLDLSFWRNFEENRSISPDVGGAMLTVSLTDSYRGLAFLLFRYLMIRRELSSLQAWLKDGTAKTGGLLEHPLTQVLLAVLSTLMLWPFFGLHPIGLVLSTTLTIVIVLHEIGHMAAYRAFGHKTVRMIFVPLLGGIAIGGRPYNSRFEVATCALMGGGMSAFLVPVAIALHDAADSHMTPSTFEPATLVFLLILGAFNLLNLLPMHRFDGGQVLRQIFEGPLMRLAGSFGVTLVILWVGVRIGLPPSALMAGLAVFTLMSLIGMTSVKPREALEAITPGERLMAGFGLYSAVALHAYAVVFACDRLFG